MSIDLTDANKIAAYIQPVFLQVLNEYDFGKYPASDYQRFKMSFSTLNNQNPDIKDALIWKWGHWGKPNFPQHHKMLIEEIENLWPEFVMSDNCTSSSQTFEWWRKKLVKQTRYITVAYITHLIHHTEPFPIIDQHNFRAMNALIGYIYPKRKAKKKPSNWNDIVLLKSFIEHLCDTNLTCTYDELDRFLMMYGRNHVVR